MFFILYAKEHGIKESIKAWIYTFKEHKEFRKRFYLVFVCILILFKTLLNRTIWINPLQDVFGHWSIYTPEGKLFFEPIENVILFIPYTLVLLYNIDVDDCKWNDILFLAFKYSFLFSLSIEMLQLLLSLGTFQFSDLTYNTIGGVIGGICYLVIRKVKHYFNIREVR